MYCQSSNGFKFPRRSLCHYPSLKTYSDNKWSAIMMIQERGMA